MVSPSMLALLESIFNPVVQGSILKHRFSSLCSNLAMVPLHSGEIQIPKRYPKNTTSLCNLLVHGPCDFISYSCPPCQLHSGHRALLAGPQIPQASFCQKAFDTLLLLCFLRKTSSTALCPSFMSSYKWYLDHPTEYCKGLLLSILFVLSLLF